MDLTSKMLTLDVSLYGNFEKFNDTLSKCRVRIFYKGMNRNRTFISEEFAKQLIDSLPYTPVKGIFEKEEVDYTDHGENNTDGRIYGVVMAEPNFAWEDHEDEDGEIRTYACADVLCYTGLYPEAALISGKSQSMEIYRKTLVGEWRISEDDGLPYYHFINGSLLGLQVLGDEVEPCFEGSAFFNLYAGARDLYDYIRNYTKNKKEELIMPMDSTLFRLSDSAKESALWELLNPNFNEENGYVANYYICDVYDDYALCFNKDSKSYERVMYTKDNDIVTLGDISTVYIVDVTESEKLALEAMKSVSGSYEKANADFEAVKTEKEEAATAFEAEKASLNEKITSLETEVTAKDAEIAEYTEKLSAKENEVTACNEKISALENEKSVFEAEKNDIINEKNELAEFKKSIENAKKEEILNGLSANLNDEQINSFKESIDTYSVADFEKEVCFAAYKNCPTTFSKETEQTLIPKTNFEMDELSGAAKLVKKHMYGGNK